MKSSSTGVPSRTSLRRQSFDAEKFTLLPSARKDRQHCTWLVVNSTSNSQSCKHDRGSSLITPVIRRNDSAGEAEARVFDGQNGRDQACVGPGRYRYVSRATMRINSKRLPLIKVSKGHCGVAFINQVPSDPSCTLHLTLFVRNAAKLPPTNVTNDRITIVEGALNNPTSLTTAMKGGVDAVVAFLGAYITLKVFPSRDRSAPIANSFPTLFDTMRAHNVNCIIVLSTPGGYLIPPRTHALEMMADKSVNSRNYHARRCRGDARDCDAHDEASRSRLDGFSGTAFE